MLKFWSSETGAVTVDWTVLTAAALGMSIASVAAVRTGTGSLGDDIMAALTSAHVVGAYYFVSDFNDIDGLASRYFGWNAYGTFGDWRALGPTQVINVVRSGHAGAHSPDGGNWISLDADPGNLEFGLARSVDIPTGRTASLNFNAVDPDGRNGVDVYFGGELIASINPQGVQSRNYDFEITGGMGDGSNQLVLVGTGPEDGAGAWIHGVTVQ